MNGICRLFVTICNMSVTAGFVILLVLAGGAKFSEDGARMGISSFE